MEEEFGAILESVRLKPLIFSTMQFPYWLETRHFKFDSIRADGEEEKITTKSWKLLMKMNVHELKV